MKNFTQKGRAHQSEIPHGNQADTSRVLNYILALLIQFLESILEELLCIITYRSSVYFEHFLCEKVKIVWNFAGIIIGDITYIKIVDENNDLDRCIEKALGSRNILRQLICVKCAVSTYVVMVKLLVYIYVNFFLSL